MYRVNVGNQIASATVSSHHHSSTPHTISTSGALNSASAVPTTASPATPNTVNTTMLANVKTEPMHDAAPTQQQPQQTASTSTANTNGHVIYTPMKRPRLDG